MAEFKYSLYGLKQQIMIILSQLGRNGKEMANIDQNFAVQ